MMRILLVLALAGQASWAQKVVYNIKMYQVPEFTRHSLELRPNFSLLSKRGKNEQYKIGVDTIINHTSTPLSTGLGLGVDYGIISNTKKYQGENILYLDVSVDLDYNESGDYQTTQANTSNKIGLYPHIASSNRFFIGGPAFAEADLELPASISLVYTGQEITSDVVPESKSGYWRNVVDMEPELSLLFGVGRIDEVQDARLALYILEELKRIDRLVNVPTRRDLQKFAELLTQINQERYFDQREWEIKALVKVDSFLVYHSLVDVMDATYFARLKDMWDYGKTPVRKAGLQFKTGPTGHLDWTIDEDGSRLNQQLAGVKARFESENPVYNSTQLSSWVQVQAARERENDYAPDLGDSLEVAQAITRYSLGAGSKLGYYPTTRTEIIVSGMVNGYLAQSDIKVYTLKNNGTSAFNRLDMDLVLAVRYYLSPQMYATGNLDINYHWYHQEDKFKTDYAPSYNSSYFDQQYKDNGFSNRVGVYLTYKVF